MNPSTRALARLFAVFLPPIAAAAARSSPQAFDWSDLPRYEGKSTNDLVRGRSFTGFLRAQLPGRRIKISEPWRGRDGTQPLSEYAIEVLHGPPNPIEVLKDGRFVLSACRAHSCGEKGLLILDPRDKSVVSATTWYCSEKGPCSSKSRILLAANGGIKNEKDAEDLLSRLSPEIGRWIDRNEIKALGFALLTNSGESIYRSNNAAESRADVPHPADAP